MDDDELTTLLKDLASGVTPPEEAARRIARLPFADLGFARVDHHRPLRQGWAEAVYGPGKTPEHCAAIVVELLESGSGPVVLTRADDQQVAAALAAAPGGTRTPTATHPHRASAVSWRHASLRPGRILIVTAGTADLPTAAECEATLRAYGFAPTSLVDCGVAGIHRILASLDDLAEADAIVAVAGMEGALASVVAGLTPAPVVAVPTSAGYGASLDGVTALLAMHASCAPGITVVGIDNGFGAACAVARVLR
jgi:NCAIR mutase (PurE)-related protein